MDPLLGANEGIQIKVPESARSTKRIHGDTPWRHHSDVQFRVRRKSAHTDTRVQWLDCHLRLTGKKEERL